MCCNRDRLLLLQTLCHVTIKMAEVSEPPPFDNEEQVKEDEDDWFSDEKEKASSPESVQSLSSSKPVLSQDTSPDADVDDGNIDGQPEDDKFFEGTGADIKLDSDEEEVEEVNNKKKVAEPVEPVPPGTSSLKEVKPQISISEAGSSKAKPIKPQSSKSGDNPDLNDDDKEAYKTEIKITDTQKIGEGMSAYIVYKIMTRTSNPAFSRPENVVFRRFSDFLGLYTKLSEKHVPLGIIVPPAPEKSVIGMTKVKMSKEDSGSFDFIEKRRAALERYLIRTATHPALASDQIFIEFLTKKEDLPKSSGTSALSGAGMLRLFHKVGESLEKITLKVEESDEWFEEKQQQVEALDFQLRKLHLSLETLAQFRRELSVNTATFAKSAAMLGNVEEHTALSRALSQLAETEEKIESLHKEQADADFFVMAELMKDYVALMGAVKDVFYERVKIYRSWKDAETTLGKKRENKAKMDTQSRADKISQAQAEVTEWEQRVERGQEDFEKISENIKKEMNRFERLRVHDFKDSVVKYLEVLLDSQQKLIKYWDAFMPEAKAIV